MFSQHGAPKRGKHDVTTKCVQLNKYLIFIPYLNVLYLSYYISNQLCTTWYLICSHIIKNQKLFLWFFKIYFCNSLLTCSQKRMMFFIIRQLAIDKFNFLRTQDYSFHYLKCVALKDKWAKNIWHNVCKNVHSNSLHYFLRSWSFTFIT